MANSSSGPMPMRCVGHASAAAPSARAKPSFIGRPAPKSARAEAQQMREISASDHHFQPSVDAKARRSRMGGCLARTCQSSNGCAEHMFAKGLLEDLAEPMRQGSLGEISRWKCGDEHRWTGPASFPPMAEHLDPRTEERRGGTECVSKCNSRGSP